MNCLKKLVGSSIVKSSKLWQVVNFHQSSVSFMSMNSISAVKKWVNETEAKGTKCFPLSLEIVEGGVGCAYLQCINIASVATYWLFFETYIKEARDIFNKLKGVHLKSNS